MPANVMTTKSSIAENPAGTLVADVSVAISKRR
jgi:hypothetical protein